MRSAQTESEPDLATTIAAVERHLTPNDLADRWGVSRGHLANERSDGRGPTYLKIGSRVLYRLADIETYESARLVTAVAA